MKFDHFFRDKIVVGAESGELHIWKIRKFDDEEVSTEEASAKGVEAEDSSDDYLCTGEINSGGNLSAIRSHPSKASLVASGGRENPLKIWDLEAGKPVFTAKNVWICLKLCYWFSLEFSNVP